MGPAKVTPTNLPIVIGSGNVAYYFTRVLGARQWSSRSLRDIPTDAPLYIIAVSDRAIEDVANAMPQVSSLVVHTSGTVGTECLAARFNHCGVLYPLQTLTQGVDILPEEVPLLLEASDAPSLTRLQELAQKLGSPSFPCNTSRRRQMHLSAVFANNFTNHLWTLAQSLSPNPDLLQPLMRQTLNKAMEIGPEKAQTGPAARHDLQTIKHHLALLPEALRPLYQALTDSILNTYPSNN